MNFVPAQYVQYLGTVLDAQAFRASPSREHIDKLLSLDDVFLSSRLQPTSTWLSLLGTLSSLTHLVPGGRLCMRALQLTLHCSWDRLENSFLVSWSNDCLQDLRWWMNPERLLRGVSLSQLSPDLDFWSDASDVGWGAHLGHEVVSGLWSPEETSLSLNSEGVVSCGEGSPPFSLLRQPFHGRGVCRQLCSRGLSLQRRGHSISGPQCHSPTYPPMVRTPTCSPGSPVHHGKSQCSGRLSLSPEPVQGSEWTLHMEVFLKLRLQWLVMIDLFATSANHRYSIYFSPSRDPQAMGADALLQS